MKTADAFLLLASVAQAQILTSNIPIPQPRPDDFTPCSKTPRFR